MNDLASESIEATAPAATSAIEPAPRKSTCGLRKPLVADSKAKAKATPKADPKAAPRAKSSRPEKPANSKGPRRGSKTEKGLTRLKRADGAPLSEMIKATGWQAHSVRGLLPAAVATKMRLKQGTTPPKPPSARSALFGASTRLLRTRLGSGHYGPTGLSDHLALRAYSGRFGRGRKSGLLYSFSRCGVCWLLSILAVLAGCGAVRLAFVSTDGKFHAFEKTLPLPVTGTSHDCELSLEITDQRASSVVVAGDGFAAHDQVQLHFISAGERLSHKQQADGQGHFSTVEFPALKRKVAGALTVEAKGRACEARLSIPWGIPRR